MSYIDKLLALIAIVLASRDNWDEHGWETYNGGRDWPQTSDELVFLDLCGRMVGKREALAERLQAQVDASNAEYAREFNRAEPWEYAMHEGYFDS